jgi:hypothetical protein
VLALGEDVENRVKEEFSEVVDAGRDKSSNAEVIGPLVSLLGGKLADIDTCKIEKGGAVVVGKVHLALRQGLVGFHGGIPSSEIRVGSLVFIPDSR